MTEFPPNVKNWNPERETASLKQLRQLIQALKQTEPASPPMHPAAEHYSCFVVNGEYIAIGEAVGVVQHDEQTWDASIFLWVFERDGQPCYPRAWLEFDGGYRVYGPHAAIVPKEGFTGRLPPY